MPEKIVFTIVPRLPPSIDGLGDYGYLLATELMNSFGLRTHFIVGDPLWKGSDSIGIFKISKVAHRSRQALLDLLPEKGQVLLHYVGYGYAQKGCPFWLSDALSEWKKKSERKLITMMHECYAKGPIWNSQFWTSPMQKNIFQKLSRKSDRCVTSKTSYAHLIEKLSHHHQNDILVMPVFSNVGECIDNLPMQERKPSLVVFGGAAWRKKAYLESRDELIQLIQIFNIKTVIDIGSQLNIPTGLESIVDVKILGNLPAKEISQILAESKIGFLNYPTDYLSKSGIFAAYCAHGMIPVNADEFHGKTELVAGKIFLKASEADALASAEKQQELSQNSFEWYQGHNLRVHAHKFRDILD